MRASLKFCRVIDMPELNMWAVCIVIEGATDIVINAAFENPIYAENYRRQLMKEKNRTNDPSIGIEVRSIALREYNLEEQEIPF